jgi:hypothetical protein
MGFPFPFTMFGASRQSAGLENTYSMEFGDADAGSAPGNSTSTAHYATGGNILDKTGGEGFTISAWIKWNATSGGSSLNSILSKRQGASTYKGYYFYIDASKLKWSVTGNYAGGGGNFVAYQSDSSTLFNDGGWHHCVIVFRGTDTAPLFYVDGSSIAISVETGGAWGYNAGDGDTVINTGASIPFLLGQLSYGLSNNYFYTGLLDEVSFFNDLLAADEITAIYNDGIPTDLTGHDHLEAWWRMGDDASDNLANGGQITDQVGSQHLTPTNTASGNKVEDVPS